jgi:hypothetical protein
MLRKLSIAGAVLLAIVAGVASASLVSPGSAAEPLPGGRDELPSDSVETGTPVPDPRGGHPWAVRIFDGDSASRCIVVGRTNGAAFGPVDTSGDIVDTGAVASGSCADPADEPVQLGLARFTDTAGVGSRSVLFGLADPSVQRVEITEAGRQRFVALDASRTFVVVGEGLAEEGASTITVTLRDGTSRTYRL